MDDIFVKEKVVDIVTRNTLQTQTVKPQIKENKGKI